MAIENKKLSQIVHSIEVDKSFDRKAMWCHLLGVSDPFNEEKFLKRSIVSAGGNFNFWQKDKKIVWPNLNSNDWFKVVRGIKPITEMNMVDERMKMLDASINLINESSLPTDLADKHWWEVLSSVYGGDPLKKRETLLWFMLNDLGYKKALQPNWGCIDYNIMLYFRYNGIVKGYHGNIFKIYEETRLRYECLQAINNILHTRDDLTVQEVDMWLWGEGRKIRHSIPRERWDPWFCYRIGCYFY